MSIRLPYRPRWIHQLHANLLGYMWRTCPGCHRMFSYHEIRAIREHKTSQPRWVNGRWDYGDLICPLCTKRGVGCVAWALAGQPHSGCPYAPS